LAHLKDFVHAVFVRGVLAMALILCRFKKVLYEMQLQIPRLMILLRSARSIDKQ
jgi:hypothetical protein